MSKNKFASLWPLTALLIFTANITAAQTIDELTDAARQRKFIELKTGAPTQGAPIDNPPSFPAATDSPAEVPRKRSVNADLYLLSIYGVGNKLFAEIADEGTAAKYTVGDKTTSGWIVASVGKRQVELKKVSKAGKTLQKTTLSFWSELEANASEPPPSSRRTTNGAPSALVNPPYPPGMFGR